MYKSIYDEIIDKYNKYNISNDKNNYCYKCYKQFTNENVYNIHIKSKKHKSNNINKTKEINKNQYIIKYILNINSRLKLTKDRAKVNNNIKIDDEIESDNNNIDMLNIENPMNLPLDHSGKPIPYWLYKLNDMNHEYGCEICGDHKYIGKKAYQNHFKEWRHTYGLKCIGLSNIPELNYINKIHEAIKLAKHVKSDNKSENVEEIEDKDGNVYNKKLYEDMKKENII